MPPEVDDMHKAAVSSTLVLTPISLAAVGLSVAVETEYSSVGSLPLKCGVDSLYEGS